MHIYEHTNSELKPEFTSVISQLKQNEFVNSYRCENRFMKGQIHYLVTNSKKIGKENDK